MEIHGLVLLTVQLSNAIRVQYIARNACSHNAHEPIKGPQLPCLLSNSVYALDRPSRDKIYWR